MAIDTRDETTLGPTAAAVLALAAGLAVAALALLLAGGDAEGDRTTAVGTVVAVNRADGSCTGMVTYAVGGHEYTVPADVDSAALCSMRGATVDVAYLPERPGGGRPRVAPGQWPVGGLVAGGLALAAVGAAGLVRSRHHGEPARSWGPAGA